MSTPPDSPTAVNPDAGIMFRAEMAATNMFFGYWKVGAAMIVAGLVVALAWGQYTTWYQARQQATADRIATVQTELYETLVASRTPAEQTVIHEQIPNLTMYLMRVPVEEDSFGDLKGAAARLDTIGSQSGGTAQVEAYLFAAELYRYAGATAESRASLEAASAHARGPLRYAAEGGIANLELEAGESDAAFARLEALSLDLDGYLAEQALFDLGIAQEHLDEDAAARATYQSFVERFPESTLTEQVEDRLSHMGAE